ncbi:hypothetical protein Thimo_1992 [Thioflavicoccus mobilis 8321]|uniref:DUF5615 domain-containing protein n=1 Tax=Thioflavicoccus mobilis 8321 TaxID=765912 RepID=L0GY56_9GAMM|nr:DUF5615 family PIN-like protein [Thioflavicoccus mobilis]AGA90757.1 hypothetical protein Thimo_1992 [Thioflavicoccus mobilis 8321]
MRVLCDVHIPYRLVNRLRDLGVDATHVNRILDGSRTKDSAIAAYGDLEKLPSGQFFKTRSENAISASLHFQSLRRLKMAGHPCPAQAP